MSEKITKILWNVYPKFTILQRNQDLKMVKIDRKSFLVIFDDYFVGTNYTSKQVISCKVTTSYANRPSRLKIKNRD